MSHSPYLNQNRDLANLRKLVNEYEAAQKKIVQLPARSETRDISEAGSENVSYGRTAAN